MNTIDELKEKKTRKSRAVSEVDKELAELDKTIKQAQEKRKTILVKKQFEADKKMFVDTHTTTLDALVSAMRYVELGKLAEQMFNLKGKTVDESKSVFIELKTPPVQIQRNPQNNLADGNRQPHNNHHPHNANAT